MKRLPPISRGVATRSVRNLGVCGAAIGVEGDTATIPQLAKSCPEPHRSQLLNRRQQVAELATRTDRLMQSNLIVVVHGMQLMEQIWLSLTGEETSGARYESTGRPGVPVRRAVFQTRC